MTTVKRREKMVYEILFNNIIMIFLGFNNGLLQAFDQLPYNFYEDTNIDQK